MMRQHSRHRHHLGQCMLLGLAIGFCSAITARAAEQAASAYQKSPPDAAAEDKMIQVYRLRYADGRTVCQIAEEVAPDVRLTVDPKDNALIAVGSRDAHAKLKELIETVDVAPDPGAAKEVRIFRIANANADELAETLCNMADRYPTTQIAVDARTNSLIVSGTEEEIEALDDLIEYLDNEANGDRQQQSTHQIRVVWLATGLEAENTVSPPDLAVVVVELSKSGITGLVQVGQVLVCAAPGAEFRLNSAPAFDDGTAELMIEGTLEEREGGPHLKLLVSASRVPPANADGPEAATSKGLPGGRRLQTLVDLETEIDAPHGHYVVLGAAPVGKSTSVFVVQVAPTTK